MFEVYRNTEEKMSLSFSGCGFMGIYHVGVGIALRKYAPQLLYGKICGASAGSMVACGLICDLPIRPESDIGDALTSSEVLEERKTGYTMLSNILEPITSVPHFNNVKIVSNVTFDIFRITDQARKYTFGACSIFFPVNDILSDSMSRILPADAHMRVNGKLHVSLTRVEDYTNEVKSQYFDREELINSLLATAFIPIFSGFTYPKIKEIKYIDGGLSNNLLMLDHDTISITPFCGEHDICPTDDSSSMIYINFNNTIVELSKQNLKRFTNIVQVPEREYLMETFQAGFRDAYKFLRIRNLIICNRCLYLTSRYVTAKLVSRDIENDPQCEECKLQDDAKVYSTMDNGQHLLRTQKSFLDPKTNGQHKLDKPQGTLFYYY